MVEDVLVAAAGEDEIVEMGGGRCETLSMLVVHLQRLLLLERQRRQQEGKFILVFDGVDRQREAPLTLLPALARLGEMVRRMRLLSCDKLMYHTCDTDGDIYEGKKIDPKHHRHLDHRRSSSTLSTYARSATCSFPGLHKSPSSHHPLSPPTTHLRALLLVVFNNNNTIVSQRRRPRLRLALVPLLCRGMGYPRQRRSAGHHQFPKRV